MRDTPVRGQTSNIGFVFIPDTTSTTGAGKTGLTNASAGLNIAVRREKSAAFTSYTGANVGTIATLGTWVDPTTGKVNFRECDSTNAPGLYEMHFEDVRFGTADTSRKLIGMVQVTGGAQSPFEVQLLAVDSQDAAAGGMTRLDATVSSRTKPADTQARVTLVDTLTNYTGNTPQTGDSYPIVSNGSSGIAAVKSDTATAVTQSTNAAASALSADNKASLIKAQTDKLQFDGSNNVKAASGGDSPGITTLLARTAGSNITVLNPVGTNGSITLIRGRDYKAADGLALSLVNVAGTWPNLTGATSITLYAKSTQTGLVAFSVAGTSPVPTGANQSVRFEVAAATTAAIPATGNVFPYSYEVVAVLSDGNTVSLQTGLLNLQPNAST